MNFMVNNDKELNSSANKPCNPLRNLFKPDTQKEQQYNTTIGKEISQIRSTQTYDHVDLKAYALALAEEIGVQKPSTYFETVTCNKYTRQIVPMTEKN